MRKVYFDYSKLKGRIKEKYGKYENLDPFITMATSTLSQKLNNKSYFDNREAIELALALDIKQEDMDQYFFTVEVRKNEQSKQGV